MQCENCSRFEKIVAEKDRYVLMCDKNYTNLENHYMSVQNKLASAQQTIAEKDARFKKLLNEAIETKITEHEEQLASRDAMIEKLEKVLLGLRDDLGKPKEFSVYGLAVQTIAHKAIDELDAWRKQNVFNK